MNIILIIDCSIMKKKRRRFDLGDDSPVPVISDVDKKKGTKKEYPAVVQWKDNDTYKTLNLNTRELKEHEFPQGSGVNPGNTPETSARIIKRQRTKPKYYKTKIGNLNIQIKSPNIVTVKKRENYLYNINNNRMSFIT